MNAFDIKNKFLDQKFVWKYQYQIYYGANLSTVNVNWLSMTFPKTLEVTYFLNIFTTKRLACMFPGI